MDGIKNAETHLSIYVQPIFDKCTQNTQLGEIVSSINGIGKLSIMKAITKFHVIKTLYVFQIFCNKINLYFNSNIPQTF